MIIELGGFHALSDAILDNSISADNPSISESMIITILHLIKYSSKPPDLHLRKVLINYIIPLVHYFIVKRIDEFLRKKNKNWKSYLMSPFFEGSNSKESSSNQYQASRLALSFLLSNWAGLSFMCHSRSLSELLGNVLFYQM